MKKICYICICLLLISAAGCYKDKGNYDYRPMPKVTVEGIASSYTFNVASTQHIAPEITIENGQIPNISYAWRINRQLISEEKDLDFVVRDLPVRAGLYGEFVITDLDTDIEYITLFKVTVASEFQNGWMILSDAVDHSELHYMRDDGEFFEDIYASINGSDLSPGAYGLAEHFLPWGTELGQVFVACQQGPDYSVELDGASFQKMVFTREEFVGGAPEGFSPTNLTCVSGYDYLLSGGKLFVRQVSDSYEPQYQDGLFPNFPYPGDYRLSGWMMRGNLLFSNDAIVFDLSTNSYMLARDGELSRFDYVNDPNKKFVPFDMDKRVLDGGPTSGETPRDDFLTFLRDDNTGEAYAHRFFFTGWSGKAYRSVSEEVFPEPSIIDDDSRFAICQNRPYAYIAHGNVLYVYNYTANTVSTLRDFGRPIRDIAICRSNYERLGIALQNADDSGQSDFMVLDVSVVAQGKTLLEQNAIPGKAVDVIYKLGDQWVTY